MKTVYQIIRLYVKLLLGRGSMRSFSQFGEDAVIAALLKQKTGVYVDIGGFHPTLYSNTYALYRRGWKGVVVDPSNEFGALYRIVRPRDTFVECAVGAHGEAIYHSFEDRAYNTLVESSVSQTAADRNMQPLSSRTVPVRTLPEILSAHNITKADFFNIDVEGMDLEVLKTHDWKVVPRVIAIEDAAFQAGNVQGSDIFNFLTDKGFVLKALSGPTCIYLRRTE